MTPVAATMGTETLLDRLSRKQIQSIAACSTDKVTILHGAVSSGKTFASLIALLIAIPQAPGSGLIVIVGRSLQTIERNIINPLMDPAIFGMFAGAVKHNAGSTTATIFGRTVHLIGASDARAEGRIRGATIGLAYADETTLLPKAFWMMLLSRLRVPGGGNRLIATTNPDAAAHWLRKEFINRGPEVGVTSFAFKLDDNPALDEDYKDLLRRQYTGLWFKRFIDGLWVAAEGSIYDMFDEARHVVTDLPPIAAWVSAGIDYGTSNPCHAVLIGRGIDQRLYVTSEWRWDGRAARKQLTDVEYSERVRAWLAAPTPGIVDVVPPYLVIDPSAASFIAQCHRDKLKPWPADNSVTDGIRLVASLLAADRLRIHSSCTALIEEIGSYCWDERAALLGEDKPIKVDDHGVDALRYALKTTEGTWRRHVMPTAA